MTKKQFDAALAEACQIGYLWGFQDCSDNVNTLVCKRFHAPNLRDCLKELRDEGFNPDPESA